MARKKFNDYGTGIPADEIEAFARVLLPDLLAFYESEEGRREYEEWRAERDREEVLRHGKAV